MSWKITLVLESHAEFSAMDYTLNIVSQCRFFFIFKHSQAPKRSWKIFHGVLEKSWIFLVSKRVGTLFCESLLRKRVTLESTLYTSESLCCKETVQCARSLVNTVSRPSSA